MSPPLWDTTKPIAIVALLDMREGRRMAPQPCCYFFFNYLRQENVSLFTATSVCRPEEVHTHSNRLFSAQGHFPLSQLQRGGKPWLPYTQIHPGFPLRANRVGLKVSNCRKAIKIFPKTNGSCELRSSDSHTARVLQCFLQPLQLEGLTCVTSTIDQESQKHKWMPLCCQFGGVQHLHVQLIPVLSTLHKY